MEGYKTMGRLAFICLTIILELLIINDVSTAQFYFVNAYTRAGDHYSNAIYKVDIDSKIIIDSVIIDGKGEFFGKHPFEITFGNQDFLISSINAGLPGKNSRSGPYPITHIYLIRSRSVDLVFQDSLIHGHISKIRQIGNDSLDIEWFADNQSGGSDFLSKFVFRPNSNRLDRIMNMPLSQQIPFTIGNYVDPVWLMHLENSNYYWDIVDGTNIVLFKVDDNGNLSNETIIGDRTIANCALGYNSYIDKLICFKTPFKLLSYSPTYESPDSIEAEVLYFNINDFAIDSTFTIDMGIAYCGYEVGKALSYGHYTYYYYFSGDGYGQFDPAYLLIFDTRTNETDWLRVGWR